jgi:hypothetical protein
MERIRAGTAAVDALPAVDDLETIQEELLEQAEAEAQAKALRVEQEAKLVAEVAAAKAEAERVRVEAKARADLEAQVQAELAPLDAEIQAAWSVATGISEAYRKAHGQYSSPPFEGEYLEVRRHIVDLEEARDDRRRELEAAFSMSSPDQGGDGPTLDVPAGVASQDDVERAGARGNP